MNLFRSAQLVSVSLLALAVLLTVTQFAFPQVFAGGAWCMPSLDAPPELGHPSYQFTAYGFPVLFVTVVKEECFNNRSTTLEWFLPGILIDGLLVGIILYVWYRQNRGYRVHVEEK